VQKQAPRCTQTEASLCGQPRWVPSWGVNRHIACYTSPYPWSCSVGLVSGWRTSLTEISADIREACVRDDALYKPTNLLYLLTLPCHVVHALASFESGTRPPLKWDFFRTIGAVLVRCSSWYHQWLDMSRWESNAGRPGTCCYRTPPQGKGKSPRRRAHFLCVTHLCRCRGNRVALTHTPDQAVLDDNSSVKVLK